MNDQAAGDVVGPDVLRVVEDAAVAVHLGLAAERLGDDEAVDRLRGERRGHVGRRQDDELDLARARSPGPASSCCMKKFSLLNGLGIAIVLPRRSRRRLGRILLADRQLRAVAMAEAADPDRRPLLPHLHGERHRDEPGQQLLRLQRLDDGRELAEPHGVELGSGRAGLGGVVGHRAGEMAGHRDEGDREGLPAGRGRLVVDLLGVRARPCGARDSGRTPGARRQDHDRGLATLGVASSAAVASSNRRNGVRRDATSSPGARAPARPARRGSPRRPPDESARAGAAGQRPLAPDPSRAAGQDDHAIRQLRRLLDVVRDEHDGARALVQQARQLVAHAQAGDVVQRGERLVHAAGCRSSRPGRAPARRAGACRRTAGADSGRRIRRGRSAPASRRAGARAPRGPPRGGGPSRCSAAAVRQGNSPSC